MNDERRAHDRIDQLEDVVKVHLLDHIRIEAELKKNTDLTQKIADNTTEIVELFKGMKSFRTFVLWCAPLIAIFVAGWAWIKAHG